MKNNIFTPRTAFVVIAVVLAALTRLLPHPFNFTAIGAMMFFAGAVMENRVMSILVSFAALSVSDAVIGFYDGFWVDYLAFGTAIALGWMISKRQNLLTIGIGSVAAAVLFFLVSNFGVWAVSGMYVKSFDGLMLSYTKGVPFFWNSLLSQVFYGAVLFGAFHAARVYKPALVRA